MYQVPVPVEKKIICYAKDDISPRQVWAELETPKIEKYNK